MNTPSTDSLQESEQSIVDEEHPWPGLASFREQDEFFFKGRESDIEKLYSLVNRERLTVLFGVSGLGKSSLLQAGLFPRLRQDNFLPITIRLDFKEDAASLSEQVFAAIARQVQENAIEAPLQHTKESLWEYFHRKDTEFWDKRNRLVVPLLCFDQFEEIFTLGRENQKRAADLAKFITELADLIEGRCPESVKTRLETNPDQAKSFNFSHHPYKLILSLREDYLADLEGLRTAIPSVIRNRFRLLHMTGNQALAVVDQTHGRLMASSVAENIVRLVGGKQDVEHRELSALRIEPALLSLICRELNERRIAAGASQIDAQVVASNREQILENFYNRCLAGYSHELRRFIEDKLITISGFRNSEAYDNALVVTGITTQALDNLVQRRLLRLDEREGNKRIELIHDVLTGVVRKSRDQRLLLEKQREVEQERLEAQLREQTTQEELKKSKRRTLLLAVLTVISLISAAWGWWSSNVAQKALNDTNTAKGETKDALRQAQDARSSALKFLNDAKTAKDETEVALRKAQDARSSEVKSLIAANEAKGKTQHALAITEFHEAQGHYKNNNPSHALAHLAQAVRLDQEWISSRTLLVNLLQQNNWNLPEAILKHKSAVKSAAFSPDGTRVVTASDNTARLWDTKTGNALGVAMKHKSAVKSATFSSDGTRVLTASEDDTARLWDAKTGNALGVAMTHEFILDSAAFSPDGNHVVTVSRDTASLWDAKTGKALGIEIKHKFFVNSAAFSPDGSRVVTASLKTALLWDAITGNALGEVMTHDGGVSSAAFSPDGTRVVTTSDDSTARLWDAKTGKPLGVAMKHGGVVRSAAFSPDGSRVVTASWDKTAHLWDAKTGNALGVAMKHGGDVNSAAFSPDGTRVVTASDDSTAHLWNAKTGNALGVAMTHKDVVRSAAFSSDGTRVVTASEDDTARLWDVITGKALGEAMTHAYVVRSATFSPDGTRVVTASEDGTARLWDAKTGNALGRAMTHEYIVISAAFSPDSTRVVTISWDGTARLWDAKTGNALGVAMTHKDAVSLATFSPTFSPVVSSAAFSPDGSRVVTTSDNTALLWDAKTGNALGVAMKHGGEVNSAAFSLDGTRVVTASNDSAARLWDAKTGKPLGEAMKHGRDVRSAAFSPDGTRVVTASNDKTARLWDAKTGKPLGVAMKHGGVVRSAAFSPDGTQVVTITGNTARLWNAKNGQALGEAMTHKGVVVSAAFSPDGTRVVTASDDNTARLWDAKTGQALGEAMTHGSTVNSAAFSPDGTRVVTASRDSTARLWDISPVSSDNNHLLAALAEGVAGMKLGEYGALEPLENPIEQLNFLRQKTANAPLGKPTAESFTRWFLSDPWKRTISPLSQLTVPEYIQQQIAASRRDQVAQEFPGHPLLLRAAVSE